MFRILLQKRRFLIENSRFRYGFLAKITRNDNFSYLKTSNSGYWF